VPDVSFAQHCNRSTAAAARYLCAKQSCRWSFFAHELDQQIRSRGIQTQGGIASVRLVHQLPEFLKSPTLLQQFDETLNARIFINRMRGGSLIA
jgi:hypothetical protein